MKQPILATIRECDFPLDGSRQIRYENIKIEEEMLRLLGRENVLRLNEWREGKFEENKSGRDDGDGASLVKA